jgi:hypothetical protein
MTEPVSTFLALLAALGKFIIANLPGAIGSAISLKFLGKDLSISQKLTSFATGCACAVYAAPAIIELCHIPGEHIGGLLQLVIGIFSLAVVRELFVEINNADLIGALKRRFLGGDK